MSSVESVEVYVARQPQFGWRRSLLRGLIRTLGFKVLWRVDITGEENIPPAGASIIMMSHTALIDPILVLGAVRPRFVIPMSKIENSRHPFFGFFIWFWGAYSVTRGEVDRKALTNSIELLKSGQLILIAPEGTRQTHGLARPKDGLAYIATKANAAIVPTAISGAQTWWEDLRHFRRPRIRIHFGKPFHFRTDGQARLPRETLATMTDEAMYQLALALPDPSLRGVYAEIEQATTSTLIFD